jgi:uracil-DNA glycosylase
VGNLGSYLLKLGERIEECSECELNCKLKKNQYCFYGITGKPKYMIIMQNPGLPKNSKDYKNEVLELEKEKEFAAKIEIWQKYFKKWVVKNKVFFEEFFENLKKFGLIKFDSFQTYVEHQMFNDFYVTDAVKCRASTKELKDDHFDKCFKNFLKKEIDYLNPKLIFAFSSRTWNILKEKMDKMENIEKAPPIKECEAKGHKHEPTLVQAHGYLYSRGNERFIIPLAHMSKRQLQFYLRNSYFDYLPDGLEAFKKHSKN